MVVNFNALDRDSSDGFVRSVRVTSLAQLRLQWSEFEKDVPFRKWYADNTVGEATDEEESWLEEIN